MDESKILSLITIVNDNIVNDNVPKQINIALKELLLFQEIPASHATLFLTPITHCSLRTSCLNSFLFSILRLSTLPPHTVDQNTPLHPTFVRRLRFGVVRLVGVRRLH